MREHPSTYCTNPPILCLNAQTLGVKTKGLQLSRLPPCAAHLQASTSASVLSNTHKQFKSVQRECWKHTLPGLNEAYEEWGGGGLSPLSVPWWGIDLHCFQVLWLLSGSKELWLQEVIQLANNSWMPTNCSNTLSSGAQGSRLTFCTGAPNFFFLGAPAQKLGAPKFI